uniref:Helicase ATP-binding domain-containing protein n=1 Tax=Oryza barthii TaxID=65489 RepID=A0A0D3GXW8_9ORYZ
MSTSFILTGCNPSPSIKSCPGPLPLPSLCSAVLFALLYYFGKGRKEMHRLKNWLQQDTVALIIGGGSDSSGIVGRKRRRCDLIRERWCCLCPVWCKEAQEVVVPGRGRNGARQRDWGGCALGICGWGYSTTEVLGGICNSSVEKAEERETVIPAISNMEKMGEKQQKSIPRDRKRKGELDPAADYVKDLWDAFYVTAESTHLDTSEVNNKKQLDNCNHDIHVYEDLGHVCHECGLVVRKADSLFHYQWKKASRKRTNVNEVCLKKVGSDAISLSEDFIFSDIAIHPRHAKNIRPHQLEGFKFLVNNLVTDEPGGCILVHAPGSGEIFMLISFIQGFMARHFTARPLVVLPEGILGTWKREFQQWQVEDIPLYDFDSIKADNRVEQLEVLKSWSSKRSILFVGSKHFTQIVCDDRDENAVAECRDTLLMVPSLLILDEGHTPSIDETDMLQSARKVQTPCKVVMSGTLFHNHVKEVFNTLDLVHPGFLKTETSWPIVTRMMGQLEISSARSITEISESVEDTLLNDDNFTRKVNVIRSLGELTKDVLHYCNGEDLNEFPVLLDFSVFLELSPKQKDILCKLEEDHGMLKTSAVGAALYVHPCLSEISEANDVDRDDRVDSLVNSINLGDGVKARFFLNILALANSAGEKLVAFSQYTLPMKFLERLLVKEMGWHVGKEIFVINGDTSMEDGQLAMDQFNGSADAKVLFGSIKAFGEGISLVGASRIVILDVHLNPSVTRQAIGSTFRPGQKKKVFVYRLVAADSPEEKAHETAFNKEVIPKLWFQWSGRCTTEDFKLNQVCIDGSRDVLLETDVIRQDIKALYQSIDMGLVSEATVCFNNVSSSGLSVHDTGGNVIGQGDQDSEKNREILWFLIGIREVPFSSVKFGISSWMGKITLIRIFRILYDGKGQIALLASKGSIKDKQEACKSWRGIQAATPPHLLAVAGPLPLPSLCSAVPFALLYYFGKGRKVVHTLKNWLQQDLVGERCDAKDGGGVLQDSARTGNPSRLRGGEVSVENKICRWGYNTTEVLGRICNCSVEKAEERETIILASGNTEKMEEKHQKSDQDFHFSDSTMAIPRERKQKGEVDPAPDCLKDLWGAFYVAVESTQLDTSEVNNKKQLNNCNHDIHVYEDLGHVCHECGSFHCKALMTWKREFQQWQVHRKYPEVYLALDLVLHGVGSVRLSQILATIHGDNLARMVNSSPDAEAKARGADPWPAVEHLAHDRHAARDGFTGASFELPQETLAAGDEFSASNIAPAAAAATGDEPPPEEAAPVEKDPFAASELVNNSEEALVGGFKKNKETAIVVADPAAALAGLEVTTLPPAEATKPTFIGVEGFEGDYGGIEFGNEEASLAEAFEGFNAPFGGGLDASEFVTTTKKDHKDKSITGLELLATSAGQGPNAPGGTPLENLLVTKSTEMTAPELYIVEEINAEFKESILARVGLKGTIFLRTLPPKKAAGKETEFSFRLEGTSGMKKAALQSTVLSNLENGMFHVRTPSKEEPIPIMKYSFLPKHSPLPLRMRLVKRHSGTLLSVMIQYASNPMLPQPLSNVTFIVKLPVDPTLLNVSPKAVLNRAERELRWHIPDIPLKGPAGRLRARMPVDQDSKDGELEVVGMVKFAYQGPFTLSGIKLCPATDGTAQFNEAGHTFSSGSCNPSPSIKSCPGPLPLPSLCSAVLFALLYYFGKGRKEMHRLKNWLQQDTVALIIGGGSDSSGIVGRKRRRCDLIRERWCCLCPVWCKEAQEVVVPGRGRNGARQRDWGGCALGTTEVLGGICNSSVEKAEERETVIPAISNMEKMGEKQQKSIPRDRKRKGELDPAADYVKDLWDAFYLDTSEVNNKKQLDNCNHDIHVYEDLGHVCHECGLVVRKADSLFHYQWKKASRKRTNVNEVCLKKVGSDAISLSEDFIFSDIAIHPRHAKNIRPHQLEGFKFLVNNLVTDEPGGCILVHAPGSGEIFMLISFIQGFMARHFTARPLVVLPEGILGTWKREFQQWQVEDIPLYDFDSIKADNRVEQLEVLKSWSSKRSILFVGSKHFTQIVCDDRDENAVAECRDTLLMVPSLLILDEGHTPSIDETDMLQSARKVQTPCKVVMSGTLFHNHVKEVFNTLDLVHPGFLKTETSWPIVTRMMGQLEISSARSITEISESVEDTLLNDDNFTRKVNVIRSLGELTKDVLHYCNGEDLNEFPVLLDFSVFLELSPKQKDILCKLEEDHGMLKTSAVGAALYVHPCLSEISEANDVDRDDRVDSLVNSINLGDGVKARFFLNILALANSAGEKLVAFSQYTLPMKFLERLLVKEMGWHVGKEIFVINGDTSMEDGQLAMDQFNGSADAKVLFGSIKAFGEGISLVGASRIVILDVHLNPSVTRQAIGSTFRPGQKKKVFVYRLVAADSPEEKAHETAFNKEVIPKLWFQWSGRCTTEDFKLNQVCIDGSRDVLLETDVIRQDIKALYQSIDMGLVSEATVCFNNVSSSGLSVHDTGGNVIGQGDQDSEKNRYLSIASETMLVHFVHVFSFVCVPGQIALLASKGSIKDKQEACKSWRDLVGERCDAKDGGGVLQDSARTGNPSRLRGGEVSVENKICRWGYNTTEVLGRICNCSVEKAEERETIILASGNTEKMEEKHQKSDQDFHFSDSTMAIPRERKQKGEVDPAPDCLKDLWGAFYVAVESTQLDTSEVNNKKQLNNCNHDIHVYEDLGHVCHECGSFHCKALMTWKREFQQWQVEHCSGFIYL